jgi:hypothetical protein
VLLVCARAIFMQMPLFYWVADAGR